MKLSDVLYLKDKEFECIKYGKKQAASKFPAGTPGSVLRPDNAGFVKYSNILAMLDLLFIKKTGNSIETDVSVYCEFKLDETNYRCLFDGRVISWEEKAPRLPYSLFPVFMYTLRTNKPTGSAGAAESEFLEAFKQCLEEYNDSKMINIETASLFCDSFFYNYCASSILPPEIKEEEDSLSIETIKKGISTGLFKEMQALKGIELNPLSINIDKPKKKKIRRNDDFQDCLDGNYILNYDWNEEQRVNIPLIHTLLDYVPEKTYYSALKKVNSRLNRIMAKLDAGKEGLNAIGNDYLNFFVVGKPGTGKTTMAYALGAATGMPTYTVSVSKHTEEDTFEGMNKVIDGKLQFVSTDFLNAYMNGGIIIIEEINLADPAVIMGAIGQAIEPPFILKKDGYQKVRRHPMCVIIGTMNIGTYGAKGVNQALSSRFKQTYILDDPDRDTFIEILKKQGHETKYCTYVFNAYSKVVNYLKSPSVNREDVCLNLSIRTCLGALQNFEDGDTMQMALENSIVGKIYEVDPELARDISKDVLSVLPNIN